MKKQAEAGKGSQQRPTDRKKFAENYDKIFRKTKAVWPFPSKVLPDKPGNPKFNPDNYEDAPL